jgi:hypothetical protein
LIVRSCANGTEHKAEGFLFLIRKLKVVLRELVMDEAENETTRSATLLNVIRAAIPELLFPPAQKAALAAHCEVEETEEKLPEALTSESPLATARLNVYRAFSPGLNTWGLPFAQFLDSDTQDIVRWWHSESAASSVERSSDIGQWRRLFSGPRGWWESMDASRNLALCWPSRNTLTSLRSLRACHALLANTDLSMSLANASQ